MAGLPHGDRTARATGLERRLDRRGDGAAAPRVQDGVAVGVDGQGEVVHEQVVALVGDALVSRLSRGLALLKFFFGFLYVGIPHGIALLIYGILVLIVVFLSWWAILIVGRFPRGFFDFVVGFNRWAMRVTAYLSYLRDEYPPFNGRP